MRIIQQLVLACIVLTATAAEFPSVGSWWDGDDHEATTNGDGGSHIVGDTVNVMHSQALNVATTPADDSVSMQLMNLGTHLVETVTGYHDVTVFFDNALVGNTEVLQADITINSGHTIGFMREQLWRRNSIRSAFLPGHSIFFNLIYGTTVLQPNMIIQDLVGSDTYVTFSIVQRAASSIPDDTQITVQLVDAYHANAIEEYHQEIQPFLSSDQYAWMVEEGGELHDTEVLPTWTWRAAQLEHRYSYYLQSLFYNANGSPSNYRVYFRVPGYTEYLRDNALMGGLAVENSEGGYTITLEVVVPGFNALAHGSSEAFRRIARYVQNVQGTGSSSSSSAARVCSVTEHTVNIAMQLYRDENRRRVLHQDDHDVETMKQLEEKVVKTLMAQEPLPGEAEKRRDLQTVVDVCHDGVYCSWYQAFIPEYCWYFTSGAGHENSYCTMFGEDYCCHQSCGECSDNDINHSTVEIPNAEHYCESGERQTNQALCEDSGCCHWNTWESGDASFNGEGRCWSSYGDSPVDECSHHLKFVEWHDQEVRGLVAVDTGYQCHYDWYYGSIRCGYDPSPSYWSRLTLIHVGGLDQTNLYTIQCPDTSFAGVGWYGFVFCGYSNTFTTDGPGPDASLVFSIERVAHKEYAIRSVGTGDYCIDTYYGIWCNGGFGSNDVSARFHMFDWWQAVDVAITEEEAADADANRRQLQETETRGTYSLARHCTVLDRSYGWCIGEHKQVRFADGTQIKYGGFKEQCYRNNEAFEWYCGDDKMSDVVISGTGHNSANDGKMAIADTIFVFYGDDEDCSWSERWGLIASSKCAGRVTFTSLDCGRYYHEPQSRRLLQEAEESHYSMTDEEREAFLDNSRGFIREDDGSLVLEEEFHQLHENWEGEIPLTMQRQ